MYEEALDQKRAAIAYLHAAWAIEEFTEDIKTQKEKELLNLCYKKYLLLMPGTNDELHSDGDKEDDDESKQLAREIYMLQRLDILRRYGYFDKIIDDYAGFEVKDKVYKKALEFELRKAKAKDAKVYYTDDVVKRKGKSE